MKSLIGIFRKLRFIKDALPISLKMCSKVTMVPYLRMDRLVQVKLIRWLELKMIQLNRESCLVLSKMCLRELIWILSKLSFWLELVILRFITRRLGICSLRIQRIGWTCMRSPIRVCMLGIFRFLRWRVCPRLMMWWALAWRIDRWGPPKWIVCPVGPTLFSRLPLSDQRWARMASSIFVLVSLTWLI